MNKTPGSKPETMYPIAKIYLTISDSTDPDNLKLFSKSDSTRHRHFGYVTRFLNNFALLCS